jgi:hypothetical protein
MSTPCPAAILANGRHMFIIQIAKLASTRMPDVNIRSTIKSTQLLACRLSR